jgi:uncharacterized damage-inducible protein DinB
MKTLADRFRRWYEYERDCNAKTLAMLASVPAEARSRPEFQKAVDKMVHLVAARRRWLFRLGHWPQSGPLFSQGNALPDVHGMVAEIESAWVAYLSRLEDADLARAIEYQTDDGKRYRWDVEGILTQTFGHAWYHRGQIAQLVALLDGKAVDTDYIFFCKLPVVETPAS